MAVAVVGEESRLVGFVDEVGGRQFRKEVQILHGFPSGPRTIPGGRDDGVLLLLILVVGGIRFWAAIGRNLPQLTVRPSSPLSPSSRLFLFSLSNLA